MRLRALDGGIHSRLLFRAKKIAQGYLRQFLIEFRGKVVVKIYIYFLYIYIFSRNESFVGYVKKKMRCSKIPKVLVKDFENI